MSAILGHGHPLYIGLYIALIVFFCFFYTAIVFTAVAGLFGSSRHLINGPTGAVSLTVFSALSIFEPEARLDAFQAMFLLAIMMGVASIGFLTASTAIVQVRADPAMRGRVLALQAIVFLGSTPIGGPLTGWLAEAYDPRWTLVLAGISGLSAAWAARVIFTRMSERAGTQSRPLEATV